MGERGSRAFWGREELMQRLWGGEEVSGARELRPVGRGCAHGGGGAWEGL